MSIRKQLVVGSSWVLIARVGGAITGLIFYSMITRALPPESVGTYFLAYTIALVLSTLACLGLPKTLTRLIAETLSEKKLANVLPIVNKSLLLSLSAALVIALLYLSPIGEYLIHLAFENEELSSLSWLIVCWLAILALRQLIAESFRGLGNIKLASIFGGLVGNIIAAVLVGGAIVANINVNLVQCAGFALVGLVISCVAAYYLFRRENTAVIHGSSAPLPAAKLLSISSPLLVTEFAQILITHSQTWVVGALSSTSQVAIFGTVMQVVILVSFPFIIVNSAIPHLVVKINKSGNKEQLQRLLQAVATLTAVPALMIALLVGLFGDVALGFIYGEVYQAGAPALLVLSIGHVVNVMAGPCGVVLVMTGHQRTNMKITLFAGACAIPLALLLAPVYGALGAAIASALGMALQNSLAAYYAYKLVGVRTHIAFSLKTIKLLLAG